MSFSYTSAFEFSPARTRKKRRHRLQTSDKVPLIDQIHAARHELHQGDWSAACHQALQKALDELNLGLDTIHILCLGLGSPASSQNTRLQLALLLDICESFRIVSSNVSLYDPVFTDDDFRVFEDLGFVILTDDKESRYVISQHPTLLYMPHCDKSLYEHVLQINWNADTLSQVIFISNRFQDYLENNAKHILEAESPHVLRLGASVDCFPLPTFTPCPSAFNNTAIQHIPAKRLAACLTNG